MRLACVQANVVFGDTAANVRKAVDYIDKLAVDGVEFVVFPEAFLTGYCVDCSADAERIAITLEELRPIEGAASRTGLTVVVGFAERREGAVFNSAALIEAG